MVLECSLRREEEERRREVEKVWLSCLSLSHSKKSLAMEQTCLWLKSKKRKKTKRKEWKKKKKKREGVGKEEVSEKKEGLAACNTSEKKENTCHSLSLSTLLILSLLLFLSLPFSFISILGVSSEGFFAGKDWQMMSQWKTKKMGQWVA